MALGVEHCTDRRGHRIPFRPEIFFRTASVVHITAMISHNVFVSFHRSKNMIFHVFTCVLQTLQINCCGVIVASEQQHKQDLRRICRRGNELSIHHFLPECIAFNQSALRQLLPECIVSRTTQECRNALFATIPWHNSPSMRHHA